MQQPQVIYDGDHFIALDKPHGWLSVPSRMGIGDPRPCLISTFKARVWPVHRLDFEVSGLVLFAKNAEAHRAASQWFENRQVHKTYEAVTELGAGAPQETQFEWRSQLLRGKRRTYESAHGAPSVTKAFYLKTKTTANRESALVWRLAPLTGRSHQLRFELAKHGYPILGDSLYGAKTPFHETSIALRSMTLNFKDCPGARDQFALPEEIAVAKGLSDG